jgi:hypothetical protein
MSEKRRIAVRVDDETHHLPVVHVERTSVPETFKLRIGLEGMAWLPAGAYEATIHGKRTVSGSLDIIDYDVTDEGIFFVGLFTVADHAPPNAMT